jgi:hypothetical protein
MNADHLSAASATILHAMRCSYDHEPTRRRIAAEILRAAVDHVVPDEGDHWRRDMRGDAWIQWEQRKQTREAFLAIAADLDPQP